MKHAALRIITGAARIGLFVGLSASSSYADSDGYYCSGDNYLAYEFRFSDGGTSHRLYVVHFSSNDGMKGPTELALPEFQVHGMRCTENVVEILGWDSLYRVNVHDRLRPELAGEDKIADRSAAAAELQAGLGNLGYWNAAVMKSDGTEQAETIDLGTRPGGAYQVRIAIRPGVKSQVHVSSILVRLAADGSAAQTARLVEGPWDTECGEAF